MADSDEENGEGFSSRWSRRKRETQVGEQAKLLIPDDSGQVPARAGEPSASVPDSNLAETTPPDVPDPDTLNESADFSVFLKDGVPEALRRRALRRLWRLNPVFANLDGLNDYDDDYTDAATVVEGIKTLYKVGKGFITEEDENEAEEKLEGTLEATADPEDETETAVDVRDEDPSGTGAEIQDHDVPVIPAPAPDEIRPIEVSGPGNRRRGALARRWGKADG